MSNVVFGRDMILEAKIVGVYTPIGCATNCSFEFTNELIRKTDVNAGLFRKYRVRMSDCKASIHGLTTLENDTTLSVLYFLQEGVRRSELDLRFRFTDEAGVAKQVQGIFLIEGIPVQGDVSAFSEFDINFQGTGGVSISSIDSEDESGEGLPGEVQWDWWDAVEGETTITGTGHYGRSFAGKEIIEVDRDGTQYNEIESTPAGAEFSYDGTTIQFPADNPFGEGIRVFVIWQNDES